MSNNVSGDLALESGKYHMEFFFKTDIGENAINIAQKNPKHLLKLSSSVINKVISKGFIINYMDEGDNKALVICKNSEYSIKHLEGL